MPVDAIGVEHPVASADARIVSLVPSVTELLFDLDLGSNVVGRTGFCVHPRNRVKSVPKVGGTKDVNLDALYALNPTHVIVNIDENERPLYDELVGKIANVIVTHPNSPTDNLDLFRLLGGIFKRQDEAQVLCRQLDIAMRRIDFYADEHEPKSVLYLIWREPWMTVSENTYIARMLELVKWRIVKPVSNDRYPTLTNDEIQQLAPDLILLSSEPYPFREQHVAELNSLVADTPISLIDGEMISWYGSRAVRGLGYLCHFARETSSHAA